MFSDRAPGEQKDKTKTITEFHADHILNDYDLTRNKYSSLIRFVSGLSVKDSFCDFKDLGLQLGQRLAH